MVIVWYGHSCFQISSQGVNIIIDPYDATIGLKVPNLRADILLVTHNHHDHNNLKAVEGEPFLITGPGEYEIKRVTVRGISSFHDNSQGSQRGKNNIYLIETEEIRICHLGDLGQKELSKEQLDLINAPDVLMIPVGGTYTIDGSEAAKITNQIEPKIVIPMHYKIPGLSLPLESVDNFLKEFVVEKKESQLKIILKKKDLPARSCYSVAGGPSEGMEVVVMQPMVNAK